MVKSVNNKAILRRKIDAYDFAILEFGMYLNTHPYDTKALKRRQSLQKERKALVEAYENKYGPYIVKDTQVKGDSWTWIKDPWPWEYTFTGKEE